MGLLIDKLAKDVQAKPEDVEKVLRASQFYHKESGPKMCIWCGQSPAVYNKSDFCSPSCAKNFFNSTLNGRAEVFAEYGRQRDG